MLTDFIDWRYIHLLLAFSTQLVNCCPHGRRNHTCVLLLCCPSTFCLTFSPPSQPKCTVYTDSVWLWGWGVLNCVVDHQQIFCTLFLTRFRTYKIASPPPTEITSKDDLNGFKSLKFLLPCLSLSKYRVRIFKLLWSQESIPRNEFATLCSLAGRYDNPIPPRFLAPICSIPLQVNFFR